ncbi:Uncharacterized protein Adt_38014 [Abeliophyllum distichum]|uniref:Uncharacterized protein n=1 Tax=Abeliophyllum distichum TaxID=126358 RepID=A0ABD1Q118_9LAMI
MSDPRFALGMTFETLQVLRAALVEYSIKNERPPQYVKNDFTRKKIFQEIQRNAANQYKMFYDYCEELKRTNEGTKVELSATGTDFKRLYMCLGNAKEASRMVVGPSRVGWVSFEGRV